MYDLSPMNPYIAELRTQTATTSPIPAVALPRDEATPSLPCAGIGEPFKRNPWPTFGQVLLSLLAIDAGVFALVWLAWRLTGY